MKRYSVLIQIKTEKEHEKELTDISYIVVCKDLLSISWVTSCLSSL